MLTVGISTRAASRSSNSARQPAIRARAALASIFDGPEGEDGAEDGAEDEGVDAGRDPDEAGLGMARDYARGRPRREVGAAETGALFRENLA
jgi:hypothetical protein